MKVKLLKKLRKRAYKEFGMLFFLDNDRRDTYVIGIRSRLEPSYKGSTQVERTLEKAKARLAWYRREMILFWVAEKWAKRCRERLYEKNKEIMKL